MSCASIAELEKSGNPYPRPKTLIVGLGNPILGDDGIGWRVAEAVSEALLVRNLDHPDLDVACFALGGLSLMERLIGYDHAIIIDAVQTRSGIPGQVYELSLEDLPNLSQGHMTAAHDTSLQTALQLGRTMGAKLPGDTTIIGIEASRVYEFSEELSPAVEASIPEAVRLVFSLLHDLQFSQVAALQ